MHESPFVFGRLAGMEEFTDRAAETAHLSMNFRSLTNTCLVAPRRWGKSSLVAFAAKQAMKKDKKLRFCMIDLFSVRNEDEFYKLLAETVLKAASRKTDDLMRFVSRFLKQLVPRLSLSADNSEISVSMNWTEVGKNPGELLDLAEKIAADQKIKIVICIDEFQNIGMFENPLAFQKKLRASWQRHKHVAYCIYGSKRNMLLEVFASPHLPFYKFGDLMFLNKIAAKEWQAFITRRFRETGKTINAENALYIARLCENHPFYVQQVAQLSWLRSGKECKKLEIDAAFTSLLDQLGLLFQALTDELSNTQVNFLGAMVNGEEKLSSQQILAKYRIGTSANVLRIKDALLEKEILDFHEGEFQLLDPLYKEWLRKVYFRNKQWG